MASTQSDPRLLYSVQNIRAFHIQEGEESELTPSGPQTLSLLMVPTTAPNPGTSEQQPGVPEEDFYLHLHLPPELDMPLPATTQIYHQPPSSYLIPRWDLGTDSGAFIRIQFPSVGTGPNKVTQEEVDTFESILAQCTAFLERARPPQQQVPYNPADYAPGEGYISSPSENTQPGHPQIVLVDEEDGSVVGELSEGYNVVEKPGVKPGSKRPVQVQLPAEGEGNQISVSDVSDEYLRMARHPAYKDSTIVQTSAMASRLIVTGSTYLSKALMSGADAFVQKTKPNPKPVTFAPATHARIRKINTFSTSAAGLSAKTVGQVGKVAQNVGASITRRKDAGKQKGTDKAASPGYKPGILNKSMIAFSTIADGLEQSARNVLASSSAAASTMVHHKYGPEAGAVASNVTGGFKNVGLVYIDATGVSRKAVIKSVAKGMVIGRMRDGTQVVVGGGDGGQVPPEATQEGKAGLLNSSQGLSGPSRDPSARRPSPVPTPPPAYGAPGTRSLGETPMSGSKQ
ncbi:hypothetical protein DTO166G4_3046 [Paecilomyces variotii]|uniref:Senescence-associated protein-domain-containing protein n=1 Tax=Byssochlamys spectabilis TaxID=264951 RepID=A0A443HZH5_BYSSP|nr:senescence-associated protein-domain-containing protein [Paecilomyces variotii]KAJ9215392.1 hypothetical protein DTO166G4_3046 [Paecilomyces variotii]KAJ9233373.1 hypothetical protein DTO166G5_5731 [Paecilomyces variotii]KAJ9359286.1 hypothetical protein DTO280E4_4791 [Paecilomyces variotii]RWQ97164.1 senescence-associated protein-domain-containing protein [Paecilomyces variotii]